MPSADFITKCQAKTAKVRTVFNYATTDYSDSVISISPIQKDSELTSSYVTVKLDNAAGTFDDFIDDWTVLEESAYIAIEFTDLAEEHKLFTGTVESVEMGIDTITMTLKDKFARMLAKTIGDGVTPVIYQGASQILANVVFDMLTTHGGLDDGLITNADIDLTSWAAWYNELEDSGNEYRVSSYLTGQTIGWCLKKIKQLTNSYIFQGGDGKLYFYHYTDCPVGSIVYTKEYCIDRVYETTMDGVIHYVLCRYGLDTANGTWAGFEDGQLIVYTSAMDLIEEDMSIWHEDATSAARFVSETLARLNPPISTYTIQTPMAGFVSDIAKVETLSNHYDAPNNSIDITVEEITYDVMNWETTIKASKLWSIS